MINLTIQNDCHQAIYQEINSGVFISQPSKVLDAQSSEILHMLKNPNRGQALVLTGKQSIPYHWLFQFYLNGNGALSASYLMIGRLSDFKVVNYGDNLKITLDCVA